MTRPSARQSTGFQPVLSPPPCAGGRLLQGPEPACRARGGRGASRAGQRLPSSGVLPVLVQEQPHSPWLVPKPVPRPCSCTTRTAPHPHSSGRDWGPREDGPRWDTEIHGGQSQRPSPPPPQLATSSLARGAEGTEHPCSLGRKSSHRRQRGVLLCGLTPTPACGLGGSPGPVTAQPHTRSCGRPSRPQKGDGHLLELPQAPADMRVHPSQRDSPCGQCR